ncbi:MAG: addiction module protein [Prosthecobacter sp.]|uniref:addiction module protein n=1 Tax=Prosthecobacter sp. TaxID=1965333 RepID=UPI003902D85C
MSTAATAIFQQAAQLSEAECEELYEQLGNHLNRAPASEEPLSSDMQATLDRRWDEITSGKVQCRDAFEVLAELRAKYHV